MTPINPVTIRTLQSYDSSTDCSLCCIITSLRLIYFIPGGEYLLILLIHFDHRFCPLQQPQVWRAQLIFGKRHSRTLSILTIRIIVLLLFTVKLYASGHSLPTVIHGKFVVSLPREIRYNLLQTF